MINRICGKCGSHKVIDEGSYAGSSFFRCNTCGQLGMHDKFPEMTVFHEITVSPEMLAPHFVYHVDYGEEAGGGYVSTIIGGLWHTESEAIAATVLRLNSLKSKLDKKKGESVK